MIVTGIISVGVWMWGLLLSLLPAEAHLSSTVLGSVQTAWSYVYAVDMFLDLDALLYCFGLYVAIEGIIMLVAFFSWVYSKIPLIGK